jgi:hypothetical protein
MRVLGFPIRLEGITGSIGSISSCWALWIPSSSPAFLQSGSCFCPLGSSPLTNIWTAVRWKGRPSKCQIQEVESGFMVQVGGMLRAGPPTATEGIRARPVKTGRALGGHSASRASGRRQLRLLGQRTGPGGSNGAEMGLVAAQGRIRSSVHKGDGLGSTQRSSAGWDGWMSSEEDSLAGVDSRRPRHTVSGHNADPSASPTSI